MSLTGDRVLSTYGFDYDFEKSLELFKGRDRCLAQYGYAIPNQEALDALVALSPVVEIGCGLGYWASLVNQMGGEVIPYDIKVNEKGFVQLYSSEGLFAPTFTKVFHGSHEAAELHSDKTLFLSWPPYDSDMGYQCLKTYLDHGGRTLVYIGEGSGGCTGDDQFHTLMEDEMVLKESIYIPVWQGIHDRLEIWTVE